MLILVAVKAEFYLKTYLLCLTGNSQFEHNGSLAGCLESLDHICISPTAIAIATKQPIEVLRDKLSEVLPEKATFTLLQVQNKWLAENCDLETEIWLKHFLPRHTIL